MNERLSFILERIRQPDFIAKAEESRRQANRDQYQSFKRFIANNEGAQIAYSLRRILSSGLRSRGYRKAYKSEVLIGCSLTHLRSHLEALFAKGMTWANRGEWEIDHVIPCAAFDLTNEREQLQCFHFSNLQPLWMRDNRSKSDKIIPCQPELLINL